MPENDSWVRLLEAAKAYRCKDPDQTWPHFYEHDFTRDSFESNGTWRAPSDYCSVCDVNKQSLYSELQASVDICEAELS